ncbi:Clp protease proteolytic subunit /translocation-enhancing protein tepA [Fadolivirus algeromassiliense]|jgi:ATP-dependent protease ClpP protease subunit|uniref:Clp protease proteolytic subunit /translocation-enhancing protein tepA n=1 Tax=Fadolivirus FV1/VV64 TaxID=3070911 RepID=A0A7D3V576_9VIRU|nr:Clp protease proteolytic subunit /translocation-enhancing protein tepA [Fadolivirus algeromassiliense]QKF93635.1 Clp protease proteolytic subunit /translocation-enhancing protein tepA [Fadolivirus FV1/VV64]
MKGYIIVLLLCVFSIVLGKGSTKNNNDEFNINIDPEENNESINNVPLNTYHNQFSNGLYNDEETINDLKLVKLRENNFVALRGKIDEESASAFINDILKIKGNKIYVYLITPGGSITSGNHIIQTIDTLTAAGKNIICIADHAYSMGFVIFQACPKRYIMQHSIIMQHQASLEVGGPIEQARNLFKLVEKIESKSNERQSKRLNIEPNEFHKKTQHDLWLYSDEIITEHAADEIVNVICDLDANLSYYVKKTFFLGTVNIEFSLCPLIHTPRNITISMDEAKARDNIKQEYENFKINKI